MEKHGESSHQRTKYIVCAYYNTPRGCAYGDRCRYLHSNAPGLGEGEKQTTSESTSPSDRHFTSSSHGALRGRGRGSARSSHAQQQGRGQEAVGRSNRGTDPDSRSKSGPLCSPEGDRPAQNPLHSLLDFPQLGSRHQHYAAPAQVHTHQLTSSALTRPSAPTTSGGKGRGRGQQHQLATEFFLSDLLEKATSKKSRPPVTRPSEAPDSGSSDLLATELDQLHLRFSEDRLSLVEKSAARQTYMLQYSPTTPTWVSNSNKPNALWHAHSLQGGCYHE